MRFKAQEKQYCYITNGKFFIPKHYFENKSNHPWNQELLQLIKKYCVLLVPHYNIRLNINDVKVEKLFELNETLVINQISFPCIRLPLFWKDCIIDQHPEITPLLQKLPPIKDTRILGTSFLITDQIKHPTNQITLRPLQKTALDAIEEQFLKTKSATIVIQTGGGKTFICGELTHRLKVKTVVVAHRQLLLDAMKHMYDTYLDLSKIRLTLFFPEINLDHYDIILCTHQAILSKPSDFWDKQIGLLVIDEAHHISAETYSKILQKFNCKVLAMTATPVRKDNRTDYLMWGAGPCCFFEAARFDIPTRLHTYELYPKTPQKIEKSIKKMSGIQLNLFLSEDEERNKIIASICTSEENKHKHIIVFVNYVAHAKLLASMIPGAQSFVGENVEKPTKKQKQNGYTNCIYPFARVIVATHQLFGEGMNNPELQIVIEAVPKDDYIQSLGRATRTSSILINKSVDIYLIVDHLWKKCVEKYEKSLPYILESFTQLTVLPKKKFFYDNPQYFITDINFDIDLLE